MLFYLQRSGYKTDNFSQPIFNAKHDPVLFRYQQFIIQPQKAPPKSPQISRAHLTSDIYIKLCNCGRVRMLRDSNFHLITI